MVSWAFSHPPVASWCLVRDGSRLAHVDAGLAGALVGAVLQTDHVLRLQQLRLRELPLVLLRHLGTQHRTLVVVTRLRLSMKTPVILKSYFT